MNSNTKMKEGINGSGKATIDTNHKDFLELQSAIQEVSKKQSKSEVIENKLLGLRLQMESYLEKPECETIEIGFFLKQFLKEFNIKNKDFALYIGHQESNLSAMLSGNRKINLDLALKLGRIFRLNPALWMNIQSKNEIKMLEEKNRKDYQKYYLEDLI